jgi:GTPase SAR1 family protein
MASKEGLTIMVVGGAGVGKTTYISRISNGTHYGEILFPALFRTDKRHLLIDYDHSLTSWKGIVNAVIIMYSAVDKQSFLDVRNWIKKIKKQYGNVYIVICANKTSKHVIDMSLNDSFDQSDINIPMFHMSVLENVNVMAPINSILEHLGFGNDVENDIEPKLNFTIDPTEFEKAYTSVIEKESPKTIKDFQVDLRVVVADLNGQIETESKKEKQYLGHLAEIHKKIAGLKAGHIDYLFDDYPILDRFDITTRDSLVEQRSNIARNMGHVIDTFYRK